MIEEEVLEPLEQYPTLKQKVEEEAKASFEALVRLSGVDTSLNEKTCDDYYKKKDELEVEKKELSSLKTKKGLLLGLGITLIIAGVILFAIGILNQTTLTKIILIIVGVLSLAGGIVILCLPFRNFGKRVVTKQKEIEKHDKIVNDLLDEAYHQMAPLNDRFDDGMASTIIQKALPIVHMDTHLDASKLEFLTSHYNFPCAPEANSSIVGVQSGSIVGNPFLIVKQKDMEMGSELYSGSLTIHWVTHETDHDGHVHTVHHSEVLTATVRKPKPFYTSETYLLFGSDAAPDLSFSRRPTVDIKADEKSLEKQVKRTNKELEKLAKVSMNDDDPHDLTLMTNREFESLWGGSNRNNEVQYRLLFTPLAQKNLLSILKSKVPYGDDFMFKKNRRCNLVASYHSQSFDYSQLAKRFYGFDHRVMEKNFYDYIGEYFLHFYFDLAPILSIPIYQQTKPFDYSFKPQNKANYSLYEHEVMANLYDPSYFAPKDCATDIILSDVGSTKSGKLDEVRILAEGFRAVHRTDFVPELGGDGFMHEVPVPYIEYIPVEKTTELAISSLPLSQYDYRQKLKEKDFNAKMSASKAKGMLHHRGLLSFFLSRDSSADLKELGDYLDDLKSN